LQVENLVLELEFIYFMLGFECQNLIVGILTEALAVVAASVVGTDLFDLLIDLTVVDFIDALLVRQRLTPRINLLAE
jgi:hypothetical protein